MYASRCGYLATVQVLLEVGAGVNVMGEVRGVGISSSFLERVELIRCFYCCILFS